MAWLLAALAMAFVGLANCGLAFVFPLEIEAREGTSWLHVMALEAKVSLYDHSQVAFLNMNHGPLDPILKYAIHALLPFLQPAMVTRVFVLLLPFGLFAAFVVATKRRWLAAFAAAGALYLFLLGLVPFHFLIGRSDPAALFFLALMLAVLETSGRRNRGAADRFRGEFLGAGVLGGAVFLINWRYLPYAVAGGLWILAEAAAGEARLRQRAARALGWSGIFALGWLMLFGGVLLTVFHGDFALYRAHFFGFFLPDRDSLLWLADTPWFEFPVELFDAHRLFHLLLLLAAGLILAWPRDGRRRTSFLAWWLPALAALWLVTNYSYTLNRAGGGFYYFAPFYLFAGFILLRGLPWDRLQPPGLALGALALVLASLPWAALWRQAAVMRENLGPAQAFVRQVRNLSGATGVSSEDLYFFETRYHGEVVDMGDIVYQDFTAGSYGGLFRDNAIVRRYFARLQAAPPRYVLRGNDVRVVSPVLDELIGKFYQPVLSAPSHLWANGGSGAVLYQLRSTLR